MHFAPPARVSLSVVAALLLASPGLADDAKPAEFPRRLLFVHVGNSLYLAPLTHATPGGADRVRESAARLADGLRVPTAGNDQLFVLSDTLPPPDGRVPTREVIAETLDRFIATTRGQDRAVVYLAAHLTEKGGKAYLVPADGDPDDPATLLPVAAVYAKLKDLEATQKVVVWDVCRHNPERARGRGDPGPMTEALFKALRAAPIGVQVLIGCSPGERGLEYDAPRGPAGLFAGSAFLDALRQAAADDRAARPKADPDDPIPVEALNAAAAKSVAAVAKPAGLTQTPAVAGSIVKPPTPADPKEAPAKRFELPTPRTADAADVKAILDELALPPLLGGADGAPPAGLPFPADVLKAYAADATLDDILKDAEKYPLRVATLRALQAVRDSWPLGGREFKGLGSLAAPVTERAKKAVADAQLPLALATARLETELANLLAVGEKRAGEPKRWQAHYDYALAELRLRLVVLNEYNAALAKVRTETLPDLPDGGTGWRLVTADKLQSGKAVREMFAAAADGHAKLAADHRRTPWAVLGRGSLDVRPGLRWEAVPAAK